MNYQAIVLSHSYSGNTRKLANLAADTLRSISWKVHESDLIDAVNNIQTEKPDLIILGTPVFYWTIPRPAKYLIRQLPKFNGAKAFTFCTYGGCVTVNVPYLLAIEMRSLGADVVGGASILSPHSSPIEGGQRAGDIMPDHGMGQPDAYVLKKFTNAIKRIAENIESNNTNSFDIKRLRISNARPWARLLESLFISYHSKMKFMPRVEIDNSICQKCSICIKGCETGSISMIKDGVSINRKSCYLCYSCVLHCPSRALTINWKRSERLLWLMSKCRSNTYTEIVY